MTDTPIHLVLRASPDELADIAGRISMDAARGSWLRWSWVLAGVAGPIAAGILATFLRENVAEAAAFGALAAGTSLLVLAYASNLANRRFRRLFRGSALRTQPTRAVLGPSGLQVEAAQYDWSSIPEVRRLPAATLLMFAPVDAFVIRDVDLPEGMTHDVLLARFGAWGVRP
jgi:hypothetical protein